MEIKKSICLTNKELSIVKEILEKYPNTIVFGSRIKGVSKRFSDLDVCIKDPISDYEYELLKEEFENSDLPFKVDIVEYKRVDNSFKKIIDEEGIEFSKFL